MFGPGVETVNTQTHWYLVCCVLCTWVFNLHQHISVQKVGGNHVRDKRRGFFLEDCSHNVVSYVSFSLELRKAEEMCRSQAVLK